MRSRLHIGALLTILVASSVSFAHPPADTSRSQSCAIAPIVFEGWQAQQISNGWVRLVIVPQLGGRLMQVTFTGHDFLFVNPKYKGKYISPAEANGRWINYGGDKIWPLPEGDQDEHHWVLKSDSLDDGEYESRVMSREDSCAILLEGPPDPTTGLQYAREIRIGSDSPAIVFHAVMKNIAHHPITWSVQSVSQYDLAEPVHRDAYNHNFHAMTPVNRHSAYFNGYQVRAGLADDPSFSLKDGLFHLHWLYLENEVWLDSPAEWIAVIDGETQFAMVEKFKYQPRAEYPGNATVIFYKNGAALGVDDRGAPKLSPTTPDETPYYMEAELNSPMATLNPGESYAFDTTWYPTRAQETVTAVNAAGVVNRPLHLQRRGAMVELAGSFGVFFAGTVTAVFLDRNGIELDRTKIANADPSALLNVKSELKLPATTTRVSLHVINAAGSDLGELAIADLNPASGDAA